jgi:spore coat polysaccharide biosynthesis protein SpsF (cytidylyltransferase family)
MRTAIVICSRAHSSRVYGKAFIKYGERNQLEMLIDRLLPLEIPIIVAIPDNEHMEYDFLERYSPPMVMLRTGAADDPLARMTEIAVEEKIDNVIRITHDKIFVDTEMVHQCLGKFNQLKLDYLYSSDFIPGAGFEIMATSALIKASKEFSKVEHISYALKATTGNVLNYTLQSTSLTRKDHPDIRLLIDYPEDVRLHQLLFATLGMDCTLRDAVAFIEQNKWVAEINRLPRVTVYTCAYNADKWLTEAMGSVSMQVGFRNWEYILIDDHSSDRTTFLMAKFCQVYKNAKWIRNIENLGLASSSNVAVSQARGKYIVRLDADDYFCHNQAIQSMVKALEERNVDVIYPANYFGVSRNRIQPGDECHHVGGALFRSAALNHVKFTDGLRNYEGLDLFMRAQKQLRVAYLPQPTFVYRQHGDSMSKTNLDERARTKKAIEESNGA